MLTRLHLRARCLLLLPLALAGIGSGLRLAAQAPAKSAPTQPKPPDPLGDTIRREIERNVVVIDSHGHPQDNKKLAEDVQQKVEVATKKKKLDPHLPNPRSITAPPFGDRLDLTASWLFEKGSDPAFASPTVDDSKWTQVDTSKPLFTDMIFGINEIWYRTHVHLAPGTSNLALTLVGIGGSYRIIVNGRELGGHGLMQDRGEYLIAPSDTFTIPNDLLVPPAGSPPGTPPELVIVLHVFAGTVDRISFTLQSGISAKSVIFLGPIGVLFREQRAFAQTSSAETGATLTVWSIVLLLAIALTILLPQVRVYPVLALYAAAHLLTRILAGFSESHYFSQTHLITWPQNLALAVTVVSALELCRLIAGSPRRLWLNLLEVFYVISLFAIYPAAWGFLSYYIYSSMYQAARIALVPAFLFFVIVGATRRRIDAIILLATGAAYGLFSLAWLLLSKRSLSNLLFDGFLHGFTSRFTPAALLELFFILGFLVVLIVHTLRIIRERSVIATEMQAARTMQQLLLARSSDPTPGFIVDTAYLPAGDVGGDFFLAGLTRPHPPAEASQPHAEMAAPDLFAIVGDVSGKGLKAAMNVSMLLGVLRREPSRDPATVLCSLNEALLTPSGPVLSSDNAHTLADSGFTTACCVRLSSTGDYTIANAGHLAPYLVGPRLGVLHAQELTTPPTLPLGLAPDQEYETITGRLNPGQRLVLLSDGIPEARARSGELYGFDRTLPLVLRPAAEIATTALAFGQEDDITVLTLACATPTTSQPPPPPPTVAIPPPRLTTPPPPPPA